MVYDETTTAAAHRVVRHGRSSCSSSHSAYVTKLITICIFFRFFYSVRIFFTFYVASSCSDCRAAKVSVRHSAAQPEIRERCKCSNFLELRTISSVYIKWEFPNFSIKVYTRFAFLSFYNATMVLSALLRHENNKNPH